MGAHDVTGPISRSRAGSIDGAISELKKAAESGDADARKAWKLVNKGEYKK